MHLVGFTTGTVVNPMHGLMNVKLTTSSEAEYDRVQGFRVGR